MNGDNGRIDWSKLERIPACLFATFKYTPAIGDADVKFDDPDESQTITQKVRQVRKRAELAAATKPMALTQEQVGSNDTGTRKLKEIILQIKLVKLRSFRFLSRFKSIANHSTVFRTEQSEADSILQVDHRSKQHDEYLR